nr:hypothetical protein [Pseudoalteromonas sp. S1608]
MDLDYSLYVKKMSDDAHEFVLAGHTTLLPPLIGLIHKALE